MIYEVIFSIVDGYDGKIVVTDVHYSIEAESEESACNEVSRLPIQNYHIVKPEIVIQSVKPAKKK